MYVARRVGAGFGLVALKLRRPLIVFSLTGLLLGLGMWAASYFNFRMWWGENQARLVTGKIYWGQVMPSNTPFAWRCEGFHGFDLKGLKPYFPPKDWGFRRALPPGHGYGGKRPPNVVLPGITIRWAGVIDTNGIGSWSYSATILLWVPSLLFGIILCLCRPLTFHRRRKRKKLGLCLKCGYDLRASRDPARSSAGG